MSASVKEIGWRLSLWFFAISIFIQRVNFESPAERTRIE
jgi:hypothetical protein